MQGGPIRIDTLVTGAFVANGYIVRRADRSDAIIIDPGAEPERWFATLESKGLTPRLLLATHAHLDHVGAAHALAERYDAPFVVHGDEVQVIETLEWQCRLFDMPPIPAPRIARTLSDGDVIDEAGIRIEAIATPGHTPGGTAYHIPEVAQVFTGDSLFAGTIGRTDLPGGDHETLIASLKRLSKMLPDDTRVRPGHGAETTIHAERTGNPFFRLER